MNSVNLPAIIMKVMVVFVGISGAFSVLFGAWLAHGGQGLAIDVLSRLNSAHQYQFIHTLALFSVIVWYEKQPSSFLLVTALSFCIGMLSFSGSLYIKTFFAYSSIGSLAPFGGILLAFGWLNLAFYGIKILNKKKL